MPIIVYKKCEVRYIRHPLYFDLAILDVPTRDGGTLPLAEPVAQQMFSDYYDPEAINIHFVNTGNNTGRAAMIPSKACYLTTHEWTGRTQRGLMELTNTFIHEIGHCFGLPHPHDCNDVYGSITTTTNASRLCTPCAQETVDRNALSYPLPCPGLPLLRRCEVFGDLLCDTEASSGLSARFVDEINCQ